MTYCAALIAELLGICLVASAAAGAVTLTDPTRTRDALQFTVVGESNANYFIENSTNMQHWRPVFTNRNAGATTTVTAPLVSSSTYYRARIARAFTHALAASRSIDLKGNNIRSDSFNSTNASQSTGGQYDPMKAGDRGDMGAWLGLTNSLNVGNAKIYGTLWTGPGGSVAIGPAGCVGSTAYVNNPANNGKIEAGWLRDDMNPVFAPVVLPLLSLVMTPAPGIVGDTNYTYVLGNDNYRMLSLTMSSGTMLVTGRATLHVPGDISIGGTAKIVIGPSGTLTLYAGGINVTIAGNGVVNQTHRVLGFQYYGLPSNTRLTLTGNGDFTGIIYAPNADFGLRAGGSDSEDFSGAAVCRAATIEGPVNFHYDESLAHAGPVF